MNSPHQALENAMDEAGFQFFSQHQPALIREIEAALYKGHSAKQIESFIFRRFGRRNLTAALIAGAAHYMERQRNQ